MHPVNSSIYLDIILRWYLDFSFLRKVIAGRGGLLGDRVVHWLGWRQGVQQVVRPGVIRGVLFHGCVFTLEPRLVVTVTEGGELGDEVEEAVDEFMGLNEGATAVEINSVDLVKSF